MPPPVKQQDATPALGRTRKLFIRWSMWVAMSALAFMARRSAFAPISDATTRWMARTIVRAKRIGPAQSAAELGALWQSSFLSKNQVPIESISDRTAIAQIHTRCPLHGSGDLKACHRMMEFDRELLRQIGGKFFVLQSQATPGINHCRVAMRMQGDSRTDPCEPHNSPCPTASEPTGSLRPSGTGRGPREEM